MSTEDTDVVGPVDYVLIEFDADKVTGEAGAAILDLVEAGTIRLYDVALLAKAEDGSVTAVDLADLTADVPGDFTTLAGARSGLLDDEDIAEAGAAVTPGKVAAILVYENAWARPFVAAARRGGGEMIASARIPAQDLMDALDAADAAD